jgi:CheY-like chemotaxis protein/HPt (histidine-containing phosphotransfer) domain-containing protein
LAEAMSGAIGVTSEAGVGSVFWFTARLPITAAPSRPAVTGRRREDVVARRILLVDDNPLNQIVAEAMLVQDGHDVVIAGDGVEALAAVREQPFDLVLMDMQMPVMDGLEAARRIRALDAAVRDIPIVALSANVMPEQIARCRDAGMNDHLAKPIDRDMLRQVVATWATGGDSSLGTDNPMRATDGTSSELEMEKLLDLFDGDRATVLEILHTAMESIGTDVQSIAAGVDAHDAAGVVEAAHHLRGTCGDLHATRLKEIAALIEGAPKEVPWDVSPALMARLQRAAEALSVVIGAHARQQIV